MTDKRNHSNVQKWDVVQGNDSDHWALRSSYSMSNIEHGVGMNSNSITP